MVSDALISEMRRIATAKLQLMSHATTELAAATDPKAIAQTLGEFAAKFRKFSLEVEMPFDQQNSSDIVAVPPGSHLAEDASERDNQTKVFSSFVSALQLYKYDPKFATDPDVSSAIVEFEHASAQIPELADN